MDPSLLTGLPLESHKSQTGALTRPGRNPHKTKIKLNLKKEIPIKEIRIFKETPVFFLGSKICLFPLSEAQR